MYKFLIIICSLSQIETAESRTRS